MQNSPDLLTSALQNPTLLEAELGRRRARDGTDRDGCFRHQVLVKRA